MADPFLGELRIVSFNFAPQGWALCNGQFLPINQNQALFALLGTTYGGNGQTTFALPDLRGCMPMHKGNGHTMGERSGSNQVTLNISQMPQHTHTANANNTLQNSVSPTGLYALSAPSEFYSGTFNAVMHPSALSSVGGSQPHENRQPSLALNFCIALIGLFPSQN